MSASLHQPDQDLRSDGAAWRAICRSQAVIEFTLDGIVIWANDVFLALMGYRLDEVVGCHHRMFSDAEEADSPAYAAFWQKLGAGEFDAGEYRRLARDDRAVWLQATYNPVLDADGRPERVLKIASDVTALRLMRTELEDTIAQLGDIVDTIRTIADQSNLLALNASIEAARAGQTGRGFGVVADEMKKLAQDTRRATERATAAVEDRRDGHLAAAPRFYG